MEAKYSIRKVQNKFWIDGLQMVKYPKKNMKKEDKELIQKNKKR
jgi:hypothetical protein